MEEADAYRNWLTTRRKKYRQLERDLIAEGIDIAGELAMNLRVMGSQHPERWPVINAYVRLTHNIRLVAKDWDQMYLMLRDAFLYWHHWKWVDDHAEADKSDKEDDADTITKQELDKLLLHIDMLVGTEYERHAADDHLRETTMQVKGITAQIRRGANGLKSSE